jgi:hypothetical protein
MLSRWIPKGTEMKRLMTVISLVFVLVAAAAATTAYASNEPQDPMQTAATWARFNRLLNPPAGERSAAATFAYYNRLLNPPDETDTTSAVPRLTGLRDFGLWYDWGSGRATTGRHGEAANGSTTAVPLLTGYHDFGLTNMQPAVVSPSSPAASESSREIRAGGFDWADAGVGAAAMLGLVLLVGGLGAAVVLRGHRGEYRSA